jgi:AAA+ superfamily predicted ATPase
VVALSEHERTSKEVHLKPVPNADLSPDTFGAAFKAFMDAMVAQASAGLASPLLDRIRAHVGVEPTQLPVIAEEFDAFEHPNLQVAMDDYLQRPGHQADLVGVAAENKRFMALSLSDLLGRRSGLAEGPVDYVNFHLADDRILSCVQFGLYLIRDGDRRLIAFITGPSDRGGPRMRVRVEVIGSEREHCQLFLAELSDGMRRLNVYRGHVISLSPGQMGMGPQTLVAFHSLPRIQRSEVILPETLLERIERQTIVFAEHAEALLAAGRSLKRGLLMFGPPGIGKTLTVMYLARRMPGRTVILTTGRGMGMIQAVGQMARVLAPAMVVLEDVDLIAQERGQPFQQTGPLLFELLNEMDGLGDDCDVIFILTTNRPDMLEPALAARPGRIDLAVELPLPDADGRRRLFELYARGLELHGVDLEALIAHTDGASPAYIKELLRKAAVLATSQGTAARISAAHLQAAVEELSAGGELAQRLLGFRPRDAQQGVPSSSASGTTAVHQTGFPGGPWVASPR